MVCINKAVKPLKKTQFLLWRLHFRTNLSYLLSIELEECAFASVSTRRARNLSRNLLVTPQCRAVTATALVEVSSHAHCCCARRPYLAKSLCGFRWTYAHPRNWTRSARYSVALCSAGG